MELSIIQRVAQLVSAKKLEALQGQKKDGAGRVSVDSVDISDTAGEFQVVKAKIDALNKEDGDRQAQVQRIKEALENGQYELSEQMVNSIAEKIASS